MTDDPAQTQDLNVLFAIERHVLELSDRFTRRLDALPDRNAAREIQRSWDTLCDLAMHLLDVAEDREIDYINELRDVFAALGVDLDALVEARAANDMPRAMAIIRQAPEFMALVREAIARKDE